MDVYQQDLDHQVHNMNKTKQQYETITQQLEATNQIYYFYTMPTQSNNVTWADLKYRRNIELYQYKHRDFQTLSKAMQNYNKTHEQCKKAWYTPKGKVTQKSCIIFKQQYNQLRERYTRTQQKYEDAVELCKTSKQEYETARQIEVLTFQQYTETVNQLLREQKQLSMDYQQINDAIQQVYEKVDLLNQAFEEYAKVDVMNGQQEFLQLYLAVVKMYEKQQWFLQQSVAIVKLYEEQQQVHEEIQELIEKTQENSEEAQRLYLKVLQSKCRCLNSVLKM